MKQVEDAKVLTHLYGAHAGMPTARFVYLYSNQYKKLIISNYESIYKITISSLSINKLARSLFRIQTDANILIMGNCDLSEISWAAILSTLQIYLRFLKRLEILKSNNIKNLVLLVVSGELSPN